MESRKRIIRQFINQAAAKNAFAAVLQAVKKMNIDKSSLSYGP